VLSFLTLIISTWLVAAPSPIEDEAFLMFLAESVEEDGEWVDPLTMIEQESDDETEESNHDQ